jgi:hypothetical protein
MLALKHPSVTYLHSDSLFHEIQLKDCNLSAGEMDQAKLWGCVQKARIRHLSIKPVNLSMKPPI